jgi:hypothetical protein
VTVHSEGPTHIVRFDDNEASVCDGDVIQNLAKLRKEAWHIDTVLRRYQDEKGILIDMLLAANDSQQHNSQFSLSEDDLRPYGQSVYGGSARSASMALTVSKRWTQDAIHDSDRAVHRRESMRFPTALGEGARALGTRHVAVAEASIDSDASNRSAGNMTSWTFERPTHAVNCNVVRTVQGSEMGAWTFEGDQDMKAPTLARTCPGRRVAYAQPAPAAGPEHPGSTEDKYFLEWSHSLPIQQQHSDQPSMASLRRSNSSASQVEHSNTKERVTARRVAFWQGLERFGSGKQRKKGSEKIEKAGSETPRLVRNSRSLGGESRSQACSSQGVRLL